VLRCQAVLSSDVIRQCCHAVDKLLGRALVESDRNAPLGYQYIEQARVIFHTLGDATVDELNDVDTWLAENAS
jgi:hypothetical protein